MQVVPAAALESPAEASPAVEREGSPAEASLDAAGREAKPNANVRILFDRCAYTSVFWCMLPAIAVREVYVCSGLIITLNVCAAGGDGDADAGGEAAGGDSDGDVKSRCECPLACLFC
jgi:hypothetical protein